MACRFPGASDYEEFWRNLRDGINSVREIPPDRWNENEFFSVAGGEGKSRSKWCGVVDRIDQFDAGFFRISPREACEMDPQQRLLLEETVHCIEDAGIGPEELQSRRTGVFIGHSNGDYQQILSANHIRRDGYAAPGNLKTILANRISYFFDLTGPSITIDGACASSLVALHEAAKSLETEECDYAIVGGVNANLFPSWKYVVFSQANMLSGQGQCKTFDLSANGYVPSDGIGVILLQRASDAARRRNRVVGRLKASVVNHNGRTVSLTAPSIDGQRELIRSVYRRAGISPRTVGYVEAHGTGTSLGDPIEVEALTQAFRDHTPDTGFCHIGSVKSNIGHAEGAAGMAGLIKVLLMMRRRWIPPTLNIQLLNPIIDFAATPFIPALSGVEWRRSSPDIPRRASVSAFGFGGNNAHVLIEEPSGDEHAARHSGHSGADTVPRIFALSARSPKSLGAAVEEWKSFSESDEFRRIPVQSLCGTLLNSRARFEYRFGFPAESHEDIRRGLREFGGAGKCDAKKWHLEVGDFTICGFDQLSPVLQSFDLLSRELVGLLDDADLRVRPASGSIREGFFQANWNPARRSANEFLFGYAYASTLLKVGLRPDLVSGFGSGAYVGVALSGMAAVPDLLNQLLTADLPPLRLQWPVIPFHDALQGREIRRRELAGDYLTAVCREAAVREQEIEALVRLAKLLMPHQGTFRRFVDEWMHAAASAGLDLRRLMDGETGACTEAERKGFAVAVSNSLHRLRKKWQLRDKVETASPALRELTALVNDEVLRPEHCARLLAGATADEFAAILQQMRNAGDRAWPDAEYPILTGIHLRTLPVVNGAEWLNSSRENRHPVRPAGDIQCLRIGSGAAGTAQDGEFIPVRFPEGARHLRDEVLLRLWLARAPLRWDLLASPETFDKAALPRYHFDRQRHWVETNTSDATVPGKVHPLLHQTSSTDRTQFASTFSGSEFFLSDHQVAGRSVLPGVAYLEMVRKAWEVATGARQDTDSGLTFTSVVWLRPIHVTGAAETVRVRLTAGEAGCFTFEVDADASVGRSLVYAQGAIQATAAAKAVPKTDISRLCSDPATRRVTSDEFYDCFRSVGLQYGPAHRAVSEIFLSPLHALARIDLPPPVTAGAGDFVLHPSMVDAALQAGVFLQFLASPNLASERGADPILPFSVESVQVFRRTAAEMWAVARLEQAAREGAELPSLDVDLCDESGAVCVRLQGLLSRRAAAGGPAAAAPVTVQPVWVPFQPASTDGLGTGGSYRIVTFGLDRGGRLQLGSAFPGAVHLDNGDHSEGHFLDRLRECGKMEHIVWVAPDEPIPSLADDRVIERQHRGVLTLLHLIRAALQEGYGERDLTWTICAVQALRVREQDHPDPTHAGVYGLAGCMGNEFPNWRVRTFDLGSRNDTTPEVLGLSGVNLAGPIAIRHGCWYRREVVSAAGFDGENPPFRRGGLYVLIGGAGGIGKAWSRWLIERCQAQIVWIGRREKDETIQRSIEELGAIGPTPHYIRADARSQESLRRARQEIQQRFGQIHGLVHSAIALQDGSLARMTDEQFASALEPNVDVCVRMAQVFRPQGLDFVLFFSSIQSFCTFAGQSNYAAGCTFKDAFADRMRQEWPCAVKVVNWGYWGSVGVVANDFHRRSMAQKGFASLEPAEAFAALEALMDSTTDQVAIMKTLRPGVLGGSGLAAPRAIGRPPGLAGAFQELAEDPPDPVRPPDATPLEALLVELLWAILRTMGLFDGPMDVAGAVAKLRLSRLHARWMQETIRQLQSAGFLRGGNGSSLAPCRAHGELPRLWKQFEELRVSPAIDESVKAQFALAEACLRNLEAILTGQRPAPVVLFPNGSTGLVESFFRNNPVADYCNDLMARAVVAFVKDRLARNPEAQIRLLEIGAGTGSTTSVIVSRLSPYRRNIETYCFSDLSRAFLLQAEREIGPGAPFLTTALFDVEKPVAGQQADGKPYDVVIATNVLHATRNIRRTLENVRSALADDGVLLLNELSRNTLFVHLTFGLLDGWWLYEDDELRLPGSPVLAPETWAKVLAETGFGHVQRLNSSVVDPGQQVLLAENILAARMTRSQPSPSASRVVQAGETEPAGRPVASSTGTFRVKCLAFLREQVAACLRTSPDQIDATEPFGHFGIDSILIIQLTNALRKFFADISSTLFFEVQTLNGLVDRLMETNGATLAELVGENATDPAADAVLETVNSTRETDTRVAGIQDVAVIGLSGRYPGARDPDEFWQRLRSGECTVTEVPPDRWDWREFYDEKKGTPGRSCTRWGGFLEDVDRFDPLFFRIAPREAEKMDPQERLFLEAAYACIEDAGYTPDSLSAEKKVGVFVGVMNGAYAAVPRYWSIANRVSYCLDLRGLSLAVDTACSSSLTAIHLAIESLRSGTVECAIAGGVNLILHPRHLIGLNELTMLSSGRECKAFGDQADGFVDAEGVGAVVLKPARQAIADGDNIYGIIRASSVNAAGRSTGYTRPNPNAQRDLITEALQRAGVDGSAVTYIEAHGTGTALGDPVEISALTQAFERAPARAGTSTRCAIGSVKSNIGHAESAAGIAGLTKILLQMKYGELAPSLHADVLNPEIAFERTPFVVQRSLEPWNRLIRTVDGVDVTLPRLAGISSFGAGGSNAHLIVEEYPEPSAPASEDSGRPALILLSAPDEARLTEVATRLRDFLVRHLTSGIAPDLASVAWTLQVGRVSMKERVGLVVWSVGELVQKLRGFIDDPRGAADVHRAGVLAGSGDADSIAGRSDVTELAAKWLAEGRHREVLGLWLHGADPDWRRLCPGVPPRRSSLPTYPFARERFPTKPLLQDPAPDAGGAGYRKAFRGDEPVIADHRVGGQAVLSAAASLELVGASLVRSGFGGEAGRNVLHIGPMTWMSPVIVGSGGAAVGVRFSTVEAGRVALELYTQAAAEVSPDRVVVHAEGAASTRGPEPERPILDIPRLRDVCRRGWLSGAAIYESWQRLGVQHGRSYRGIEKVFRGDRQVLARISLPASDGLVLNPGTLDSAFQASLALFAEEFAPENGTSHRIGGHLPFAVDALEVHGPCPSTVWAWVRQATPEELTRDTATFDIDLCDEDGAVCVLVRGLACRRMGNPQKNAAASETRLSRPVWTEAVQGRHKAWEHERHVLVLGQEKQSARHWPDVDSVRWRWFVPDTAEPGSRFRLCTLQLFELTRSILERKPTKPVLLQVVIPPSGPGNLLEGLEGFLRTAALENPLVHGQLIETSLDRPAEEIAARVEESSGTPLELHVRYEEGQRQARRMESLPPMSVSANMPWKNNGVYLITGGAGGLGLIFAREIARQTGQATVILVGRSALDAEHQRSVEELERLGARVEYRRADVSQRREVRDLIVGVLDTWGALNGVLHAAGVVRDSFILRKTASEICDVLAPKVEGTLHLDEATREVPLDFFVLFSSVAAMGNPGQADYSAANAFLDQFACLRKRQVDAGQRSGRTVSINWPLWRDGGMTVHPSSQLADREDHGRVALDTASGLAAFYDALARDSSQIVVEEVEVGWRSGLDAPRAAALAAAEAQPTAEEAGELRDRALQYFRGLLSEALNLPASRILPDTRFDEYGLDSVLVTQMNRRLERDFGPLSKTLFFEYQTLSLVAEYFLKSRREQLRAVVGIPEAPQGQPVRLELPAPEPALSSHAAGQSTTGRFTAGRSTVGRSTVGRSTAGLDIVIVGLSGRYPGARDVEAFWENLRNGIDSVTEVPRDRWDWREYYADDARRRAGHNSKWGGFMEDVDKFDALFFNISPREAELMDPQERLFLEHTWMALEDAGYSRESLAGGPGSRTPRVGVYAGAMYGEYQLFGAEATLSGQPMGFAGTLASIANRVSWIFDFHGPSMTVDSMCSSSLTSLHLACQDLRCGRIDMGVAGGVNVLIHPNKYLMLSGMRFLSDRGRCESFGEGGDGYVPGEGVGVVVLKRLADAERDGDHIYAVIRGTGLNHGGRTSGYTVPSPAGQEAAISQALEDAGVDARTLTYIEAHGTGTKLGDPIEISGLGSAFTRSLSEENTAPASNSPCWIGSVKSNIGHCEAAAGVAGLTKVLLQIKHGQLAPSLHSRVLNSAIDFSSTPFAVNQELREWRRPVIDGVKYPRRAGISSFGAGGANAHVIVEEYAPRTTDRAAREPGREFLIVLSAKTEERLREHVRQLQRYLEKHEPADRVLLEDLALTLQVGREAMEERLGLIVRDADELRTELGAFLAGTETAGSLRGRVERNRETLAEFSFDEDMAAMVANWMAKRKFRSLLRLWVKGLAIDWRKLYEGSAARRISLPTYPFERKRHWISVERRHGAAWPGVTALHPLLHENTSHLREVGFSSTFTGQEFFFEEQPGEGSRRMTDTAQLEMALAAVRRAAAADHEEESPVHFRDVSWGVPIAVNGRPCVVHVGLTAHEEKDEIRYRIYSQPASGGDLLVHSEGSARFGSGNCNAVRVDLGRMRQKALPEAGMPDMLCGDGFRLTRLRVSDHSSALIPDLLTRVADAWGDCRADESCGWNLREADVFGACPAEPWAVIRRDESGEFDVDVCDSAGIVHFRFRGLQLGTAKSTGEHADGPCMEATTAGDWDGLTYVPVWAQAQGGASRRSGQPRVVVVVHSVPRPRFLEQILRYYQAEAHATNVIAIGLGDETRRLSDTEWLCNVNEDGGFERCLGDVSADHVYFAASLTDRPVPVNEHNVTDRVRRNEIQLLRLAKFLGSRTAPHEFVDWYILSHGCGVTGLACAMAQGDHRFRVRNLELSSKDLQNPSRHEFLLQAVLVEAPSDRGEVTKLNAGGRYQRSFVKLEWQGFSESGLRQRGVYVIVGGSGEVGRVITRSLIRTYKAQVIWIGRKPEDSPEIQGRLAEFRNLPHRPFYIQADVTQPEPVRQAVRKIKQQQGSINGAIFCGAILRFGNTVKETTEDEFEQIAAVKAQGSVNFFAALREEPLDFLCYFSSAQSFSFINGRESCGYATGNTFSDHFVRSLPEETRFPVGVINWGYWQTNVAESGLAERIGDRFGYITDEEGFQLFERFTGALRRKILNQVVGLRASAPIHQLMRFDEARSLGFSEEAESILDAVLEGE